MVTEQKVRYTKKVKKKAKVEKGAKGSLKETKALTMKKQRWRNHFKDFGITIIKKEEKNDVKKEKRKKKRKNQTEGY